MTQPHVRDLLPLWVGGDLPQAHCAEVEAHLASCAACRAEAEALAGARAWLQADPDPPFGAADGEALRRAVLAQLASRPPRRVRPLRSVLFGLAASLGLLGLGWGLLTRRTQPVGAPPEPQAAQVLPETPEPPAPVSPGPRRVALRRTLPAPASGSLARMHFQTEDPNIRIIWLAQAAPAHSNPETTHP